MVLSLTDCLGLFGTVSALAEDDVYCGVGGATQVLVAEPCNVQAAQNGGNDGNILAVCVAGQDSVQAAQNGGNEVLEEVDVNSGGGCVVAEEHYGE